MFNDSKQPVYEQQIGNAQIIKKSTSKAGIFSSSVGFIKKHRLATAITIAIIIGLFAVIPSINLGELKIVKS